MATKGQKNWGGKGTNEKWVVRRHSSNNSRRACNALEKALETKTRQASKKMCLDY